MKESKESLLDRYSDLVWKVIKLYPVKTQADNQDAFQAGCLGLCEAYNRFDESKGHKFSTFAFPWIQKYVREFSRENSFYVHIPANQLRNSQKVFQSFLGHRSKRLLRVEAIRKTASSLGMEISDVQEALSIYQGHRDHNTYLDDPECVNPVGHEPSILEAVTVSRQIDKLKRRSRSFSKREQEILRVLYFGDNVYCETVSEAGKLMGISKQSAQELHKKAITKLKRAFALDSEAA